MSGSRPLGAVIAAALLLGCALPVCAADIALPAKPGQPFNMTILGKSFTFRTYELEGPARTWTEVKAHLPRTIFEKPRSALSDRQITQRIDALARDRRARYGAALGSIADTRLDGFRKERADADRELFQLVLAENCISNVGGGFIPASVLRLCQEYTALLYLREMLREATGIDLTRIVR